MGLDIYLKKYDDFEDTIRREKEYNDDMDERWNAEGEYESISEERKEELRKQDKELAEKLGLGEWGSDEKHVHSIEMDSPGREDHYFKIGYFRSSYNGSGINRILSNLGLPDLYELLGQDHENVEYHFRPNWEESLERVNKAIEDLKKAENIRVRSVSHNLFTENTVSSEEEAMEIFRKELEKKSGDEDFLSYSNSVGEFYLNEKEPLTVLGMIPGKTKILRELPCVYVVTKGDNEWYVQALEIIKETIEYVLNDKENIDKYVLHWSG